MNSLGFDDDSVSRQDRSERWATMAAGQRVTQADDAGWDITTPQLIGLTMLCFVLGAGLGLLLFIAFPNPVLF